MNLEQTLSLQAAKKAPEGDGEPGPGHKIFNGFFVKVEHPAGSVRTGIAPDGQTWAVRMANDYGELPGSIGSDGDPVDAYLGPHNDAKLVHVIHMHDPDGAYNEDKAMIGFKGQKSAIAAFRKHYAPGVAKIGAITSHTVAGFRKQVRLSKKAGGKKLHATY